MPAAARVDRRPIAQVYVTIDGAAPPDAFLGDMVRFVVESSVHLADMATIELHNPELRWTEGNFRCQVGKALVIEMGERDHKRPVFDGEITALEFEASSEGTTKAFVTAYDRGHRLHRGRKTRTFLNATDSDIVKKVASGCGLEADLQSTSIKHEWVLQHNQTDWEFLHERASRYGYALTVSGRKLVMKPQAGVSAESIDLTWRRELLSFRARMTVGEQVDKVTVRGWDPVRKRTVSADASRAEPMWSNGIADDGARAAQPFGAAAMVVLREAMYSQDQASERAQAVLDELGNNFVQVEGRAMGNPMLRTGSTVHVDGVGTQFSGSYIVTEARHTYERAGYTIDFKASGKRSTDVISLMKNGAPPAMHTMTGVVSNNKDPEDLGRVKVKLPVLGDDIESHWCRIASPGAGASRGMEYLPEVDDEVLVIGTHMDDLYVVGGLWNSVDKVPEKNADVLKGGKVARRIIRSRTGHIIAIDDSDDGGSISIIDSTGKNRVVIDTKGKSLELVAERDIKIEAGGNLQIESKTGATSMKAGTDFKIESMASATVDTQGSLALTGAIGAKLQSNAMSEVKAPMVNIGM